MIRLLIGFILLSLFTWACNDGEEVSEEASFNGPLIESDSIEIFYSDSAVLRARVEAPKQYDYENGNREFPQGIYVEFFEPDGTMSSTLQADKGYYFKDRDRYTGVGNVVVRGLQNNNRLDTDTLHWLQSTGRVYTKAPVLITEDQDTLRGIGLETNQRFTTYTILDPVGSTVLKEDEPKQDEQ